VRLLFWNIRGFGRPARRRQIRDYISEENLDGISLHETIKGDFTNKELSEIAGGNQFRWAWLGAKGHSGGILMGVKEDLSEVEDTEIGEFYVSMVLRHRTTNFRWEMMTVYGPAHPEGVADFIAELSRKCFYATLPMVMGAT
jgi:hypothetical protein